jgi:cell division protein FtsB
VKPGRVVAGVVAVGGLLFGYAGGEYSTADLRTLRDNVAAEREAIGRLEREIDSLRPEAEALETDSAAQERAARERFGMLRPGELLYRIERGPPGAGRERE